MDGMASYDRSGRKKMRKNNSDPANLLYTYDQETGHIGMVPASPLLLPFLMIMSLVVAGKAVIQWIQFRQWSKPENVFETRGVTRSEYNRDRREYLALVEKQERFGLTYSEQARLNRVMRPRWLKPGEPPIVYK